MGGFQYVAFFIPILLFFVWLEYYISRKKDMKVYHFSDSIVNTLCGIMERLFDFFFVVISYFAFGWLAKFALIEITETWFNLFLALLAADFLAYWHHRACHQVNVLWAGHIVHHQSEELNLTTVFRVSGFAVISRFLFFIWLPLIGFSVNYSLLAMLFIGLYQFVTHTRLVGNLGFLEYIFVTPSSHRVHHGRNDQYIDKNYGHVFIIWDRMLGTFVEETEDPEFGIIADFKSSNPFWAYFYYWIDLFKRSRQIPNFADKILLFFKPPAWMPKGMDTGKKIEGPRPPHRPTIPARLRGYIFANTSITMLLLILILVNGKENFNAIQTGIAIIFLLASIYSLGLLLEKKKFAVTSEIIRISLILVGTPYLLYQYPNWSLYYIATVVACIAFLYWIFNVRDYLTEPLKKQKEAFEPA